MTSALRKALDVLPRGTVSVGAGLVVLGIASYVQLAVAGHMLTPAAYSSLSVLWSLVFSLGPGLFFPIEQEVTRLVAARQVTGDGSVPVYRRGATVAFGLLAVLCALLFAGAGTISGRLFGGDRSMVAVLAGALAGLALAHPTRGVLAGSGRFGGYGTQLGVDGGLRIVCSVGLGLAGIHSAALYGLTLVVAPVVSVATTAVPVRRALRAGAALAWASFAKGVGPLTVSLLLAQLVVNIAVVDIRLLAPHDATLAGALLSAIILARVPLFVFASLQAALLPGLSRLATTGDRHGFGRLLLRGCALVSALSVVGGVPAVLFGPWLIRTLFAAAPALGDVDFVVLVAGTSVYMLALVLGQGLLALGFHRDQTLAWVFGTAILVVVTLVPGEVKLRVEAAYALGSLAVAALLAAALVARSRGARAAGDRAEQAPPATVLVLGGSD